MAVTPMADPTPGHEVGKSSGQVGIHGCQPRACGPRIPNRQRPAVGGEWSVDQGRRGLPGAEIDRGEGGTGHPDRSETF